MRHRVSWAVVADRLAHEYGWSPDVIGRLTIGQVKTFWEAINARHRQESVAPVGQSSSGERSAIQQFRSPDGRVTRRYNLGALTRELTRKGVKAWKVER